MSVLISLTDIISFDKVNSSAQREAGLDMIQKLDRESILWKLKLKAVTVIYLFEDFLNL